MGDGNRITLITSDVTKEKGGGGGEGKIAATVSPLAVSLLALCRSFFLFSFATRLSFFFLPFSLLLPLLGSTLALLLAVINVAV